MHPYPLGCSLSGTGASSSVAGNGSGGREEPKGEPFGRPYQLYDLQADPAEQKDVLAEHPEVARRLEAALDEIRASGRSRP